MSLVLEAILKWESFDAELLVIAGAGLMKIGDIVSDLLFTKELSEFNSVFHDLDGEEVRYRPPITELIALSVTFTIIGILFDLYKGYYIWKENRNEKANETDEERNQRKLELVKYIEATYPFMLLQRITLKSRTDPHEEIKPDIEENDKASIDEAVAITEHIDEKKTESKTNDEVNEMRENDSIATLQNSNGATSKLACKDDQDQDQGDNDTETEYEDDAEEKEDKWKWWKRLNLIFEEIPQLMILIFFYQKVILVRDCDSVKEKIELCDNNTDSRMLYSELYDYPFSDVASPAETISKKAIPKIIIQTAPNDPKSFDPQWPSFQAVLHEMNPDFDFYVFDDDEALQFIDAHFKSTELPKIYRNAQRPVLRADLFRLASVSVLGGFYMDMDMLAKQPFSPIVDAGFGAVFPREWRKDDPSFISLHFKQPTDEEDQWQVGNYAFGAIPNHPFVVDALKEAMRRCQDLISSKAASEVTDFNVLHATGPYMLTEVYHKGRKNGKYDDVHHMWGDDDLPFRSRSYGDNTWHKFGPYGEHMLSHSWVTQRKLADDSRYELYTNQDPLVKPITVLLQLSSYPEYISWSIESVDGGVTYANYDQGTYNSNQAFTNVTETVFVHPSIPLEFSFFESLEGISNYALFEGSDLKQGKQLTIDSETSNDSGSYSAFFKLPEKTLAPTSTPSKSLDFEYYTDQDPFVEPITVLIQLYECPQYVSWSIQSDPKFDSILYAEYNKGSYSNQAFNNITEVVYVHPSKPLVFNLVDGEFCGVLNYAIFEGNNETSKEALLLQGQEGSLSSIGSVSESFTLQIKTTAPTASPSFTPTHTPNFELFSHQDPSVKPITVIITLYECPQYFSWSINSDDNITYAKYSPGTYSEFPPFNNATEVVYVHPNTPMEFTYLDPYSCSFFYYAIYEGVSNSSKEALILDGEPEFQSSKIGGPVSKTFMLKVEATSAPTSSPTTAPSTTPSTAPVITSTPPPTPVPTPRPTPKPLTKKEEQICENKKYFVAACGSKQQEYTNDLFVSSVTSIVFTSLTTAGILIGWLRYFWRKRKALARRRTIHAKKMKIINHRNFHYHNHRHWNNIASHFKQQETKQKELSESLQEGTDRDKANKCAAWAANNAEYCFQISNDHYKQAQELEEKTSTVASSDEESGES